MIRKSTITILITVLSLTCLYGQEGLFPTLKGYKAVNEYPVYTPDDLWNYIDGAADAYLALGFLDLNITEYKKGKKAIKAEIYRFGDDAMAFGMYSLERSPGYDFIQVGVQGYNEDGVVFFYKDRYYIKIMTQSESKKVNESMKELAGLIAARIDGKNEFPALLKLFPSEGLVRNQETYILESVLGHEFLRGAFRASYEVDNDRFDVYLFNCKSSEEASAMAARLAGDAYTPGDDIFKYVFEDGFNGMLHMAQQRERIVIVSGLGTDKTPLADRYINSLLRL
jgi:hypothetical protein